MYMHDRHLTAIVAQVDLVRDELRLIGVDERDQLVDSALQLLEPSVVHVRGVDVYERPRHVTPFGSPIGPSLSTLFPLAEGTHSTWVQPARAGSSAPGETGGTSCLAVTETSFELKTRESYRSGDSLGVRPLRILPGALQRHAPGKEERARIVAEALRDFRNAANAPRSAAAGSAYDAAGARRA
jgi:hypothetical protein